MENNIVRVIRAIDSAVEERIDNMFENFQDDKVIFNYQTNETKYYFLTGGSGYPLAEFMPQGVFGEGGTATGMVIAEKRQKTTNTVPWIGLPNLDLKQKK